MFKLSSIDSKSIRVLFFFVGVALHGQVRAVQISIFFNSKVNSNHKNNIQI